MNLQLHQARNWHRSWRYRPSRSAQDQARREASDEARQGRNPQTGEIITIPAKPKRTVVKVLPLKVLKEVVK
jgi:hypothetical protein